MLAVAHDHHGDFLANRCSGNELGQIARFLHILAIEGQDHVAGFQTRRLAGALLVDHRDQRAARGTQLQRFRNRIINILDAHAEPAAPGLAELHELRDDRLDSRRRGCKTDADRTARRRQDRRVDADDLTVHVEQRTAGIALVDGSVSLDVIVVGTAVDVAVAGRDNARRHRAAQPERIADRHHPLADTHLFAVAEFYRLQRLVRLHAQHGDIDLGVLADDFGLQLLAIGEDDRDVVGVADDMIVGDHNAGGIDHEARTQRGRAALLGLLTRSGALAVFATPALPLTTPEEFLEKIVERCARRQVRRDDALVVHRLRDGNIDHRRAHIFCEIGEGFGRTAGLRHHGRKRLDGKAKRQRRHEGTRERFGFRFG